MLIILEDLGKTGSVTKNYLLSREQFYLDLLFKDFSLSNLNFSPTAGSTLGFKHKKELNFVLVELVHLILCLLKNFLLN